MTRSIAEKPKRTARKQAAMPQIRTYRSAVNYLNSLTNFERVSPAQYNASNVTPARTARLLSALGNPHRSFRSVHIAGTKGKGSTAHMLAAMLQSCGHKVGLYTSPHLLDVRERIVIDGEMISESAFTRAVKAVAQVADRARVPKPTYFEVLTAAAFYHFGQQEVDLAIVETGIGGRLDCTNVIRPEVVGITSISYDHMSQLGETLPEIAEEKAGVIKKGVPVVCAPQSAEVKETIRRVAEEVGAPLKVADEDVSFSCRFEFSRTAGRHTRICLTTPTSRFEHLHVPLLGDHQAINCGVALNMLDVLKNRGFEIDDQQAMAGLAGMGLPGRMELICDEPRILVDGAHNAASIDALMRAIGQNIPYDSMVVIFGCLKHKDIPGMIRRIQLGADKVVFTRVDSPQSADPHELAADYSELSGKPAQVGETLEEAVEIAECAVSRGDLICITGSFYLVGEAKRKFGQPVPA
jgi:dihydrofolate synthase/folylpolyglutamate synthase